MGDWIIAIVKEDMREMTTEDLGQDDNRGSGSVAVVEGSRAGEEDHLFKRRMGREGS